MLEQEFHRRASELVRAAQFLYKHGWVPATSGTISVRLSDDSAAITIPGQHKGHLDVDDIMRVDVEGQPLDDGKTSPESLLHARLYKRFPKVGAVLHVNAANATSLSRLHKDEVIIEGYELLKAFPGIDTHEHRLVVPVFPNDQNIVRLARVIDDWMDQHPVVHGYMIAAHGFFTWGETLSDALRHVEAFEFLFECELKLHTLDGL